MARTTLNTRFDDDDWHCILELMRLGITQLEELLASQNRIMPEAALCESLRRWIQQAHDIRARINAR